MLFRSAVSLSVFFCFLLDAMPSATLERRLPCYEGHLILNHATLSDAPQTSNGTAWSERWCSLEDGKLLVYTDRTAAMIDPEHTCAVIHLDSFACVQPSTPTSEHPYQLVLSTTPPETSKSSRLFRPKSAMSLNRLQAESISRHDSLDLEPRPSIPSISRMSIQSRPFNSIELSHFSPNSETANLAANPTKSWSKFGFGSRSLYAKLSSSSNRSPRINHNLASHHSASATSSIISSIEARASTDVASSGAPSPRTPQSATFSPIPDNIPIRATSPTSYTSWLEALALTIKIHSQAATASSPLIKQQSRVPTRPSLGNLSGFRTPAILHAGPVFPSTEANVEPDAQDDTPKATRQRHSSTASLSFALSASSKLQENTLLDQQIDADVRLGDKITFNEPRKRRPSTADALSSAASHVFGVRDAKGTKQGRKHKRSASTASSSLSSNRFSDPRSNGVSSPQLLASASHTLSPTPQVDAGIELNATLAPAPALIGLKIDALQESITPTSGHAQPASRHRRSGSLIKFGSARIMAWRDTFTVVDQTATAETLTGLGLQMDQSDSSALTSCSDKSKAAKALSGFKSLRLLAKSKRIPKDANPPRRGESVSFAWTPVAQDSETTLVASQAASQQPAAQSKSKRMSRSTSLLGITKTTFASLRERSSSRQSIRTVFAAPHEEASIADQWQESGRIQTADCDFGYELVQDQSASTLVANATPDVSVADDNRADATQEVKHQANAVDSIADKLGNIKLQQLDRDGADAGSPSLASKRILPPKQIIDTFDKLRAADPTGRSCDWLRQIEACGRRGSLDWAAATPGVRRPSLRAAASQTFATRGASMDLLTSGAVPRLRSSMSAWDLGGQATMQDGPVEGRVKHEETQPATPRMSGEDPSAPRSLPAPPRAYKRRARVSSSQPSRPTLLAANSASSQTVTTAFTDLTNTQNAKRRSSGKIDTATEVVAPRSPIRLGSRQGRWGEVYAERVTDGLLVG